ncbi:MAG: hypothetical protein HN742_36145 [Lentisphaerae bacterium]|nr:hypothetical protein [Lentisphaerota bacterium]MBT4822270.1 hypothetical protein [Lentisphaerota bacterium]MBT5604834.1 hypothetical protein [Lentisphaerota bacterium]MBT7056097.1 hypothetical protein [Lentisphaerota bacterium]MBT7847358.1 hypothetical protein [Lentisphaerota bacterium]
MVSFTASCQRRVFPVMGRRPASTPLMVTGLSSHFPPRELNRSIWRTSSVTSLIWKSEGIVASNTSI